jgi:hypothetical protein
MTDIHLISYEDYDQECDAEGNWYQADTYFVSYCWERGYMGPDTWATFLDEEELEKVTCEKCLVEFSLLTLANLP